MKRIHQKKLYEHIGYFFYAIVAADGKIKPAEIEMVKKLVSEEWDPAEESRDEFDTDLAEYIYFTFDFLLNQELSAQEAFDRFKAYLEEHSGVFDEELLKKIIRSAKLIASSYPGAHKAEEFFIKELKKTVKQIGLAA